MSSPLTGYLNYYPTVYKDTVGILRYKWMDEWTHGPTLF